MKKGVIAISLSLLVANLSFAKGISETIGNEVGSVVGGFVNGFKDSAKLSGNVIIAEDDIGSLDMKSEGNDKTDQAVSKIEVDKADINFVIANTVIRGDSIMVIDSCQDECRQAVHDIIIKTGGKGFSGVYSRFIAEGKVSMDINNSPNATQYIHHIKVTDE